MSAVDILKVTLGLEDNQSLETIIEATPVTTGVDIDHQQQAAEIQLGVQTGENISNSLMVAAESFDKLQKRIGKLSLESLDNNTLSMVHEAMKASYGLLGASVPVRLGVEHFQEDPQVYLTTTLEAIANIAGRITEGFVATIKRIIGEILDYFGKMADRFSTKNRSYSLLIDQLENMRRADPHQKLKAEIGPLTANKLTFNGVVTVEIIGRELIRLGHLTEFIGRDHLPPALNALQGFNNHLMRTNGDTAVTDVEEGATIASTALENSPGSQSAKRYVGDYLGSLNIYIQEGKDDYSLNAYSLYDQKLGEIRKANGALDTVYEVPIDVVIGLAKETQRSANGWAINVKRYQQRIMKDIDHVIEKINQQRKSLEFFTGPEYRRFMRSVQTRITTTGKVTSALQSSIMASTSLIVRFAGATSPSAEIAA